MQQIFGLDDKASFVDTSQQTLTKTISRWLGSRIYSGVLKFDSSQIKFNGDIIIALLDISNDQLDIIVDIVNSLNNRLVINFNLDYLDKNLAWGLHNQRECNFFMLHLADNGRELEIIKNMVDLIRGNFGRKYHVVGYAPIKKGRIGVIKKDGQYIFAKNKECPELFNPLDFRLSELAEYFVSDSCKRNTMNEDLFTLHCYYFAVVKIEVH